MTALEIKEIKQYLARIGKTGGEKSRRKLTPAEAKSMVKRREMNRELENAAVQLMLGLDLTKASASEIRLFLILERKSLVKENSEGIVIDSRS